MPAPRPRCTGGRGGQPPAAASANGLAVRTERGSCCFVNMGTGREHRLVRGERAEIKTWPEEADYSPLVRGTAERSGERGDRLLRTRCRVAAWALTFRAVTSLKLAAQPSPGPPRGLGHGAPRHRAATRSPGCPLCPLCPAGLQTAPRVSLQGKVRFSRLQRCRLLSGSGEGAGKNIERGTFEVTRSSSFPTRARPEVGLRLHILPPGLPFPAAMTSSCLPFP